MKPTIKPKISLRQEFQGSNKWWYVCESPNTWTTYAGCPYFAYLKWDRQPRQLDLFGKTKNQIDEEYHQKRMREYELR